LKNKFLFILVYIFSWVPSAAVFYAAYHGTDYFFQLKKFPYPFESFGIAAGLGAAFWVYAVFGTLRKKFFPFHSKEKIA
jgi:hypothetical protein